MRSTALSVRVISYLLRTGAVKLMVLAIAVKRHISYAGFG
jgi:hypothetical protein